MNNLPDGHRQSHVAQTSGATRNQGSKKRKKHFTQFIFRDWCKACGICSAFCPKGVLGRSETGAPIIQNPDACIGCRFCELHCPDFAISIREDNGDHSRNGS